MLHPRLPSRVQYVLLLLSPFFFWGTAMVAMKGVMPHTAPFFMAAMRLFPAGLLILVATVLSGRSQPRGLKAWGWIALFALVDGTLFQGFLALGLQDTGAGLGSVLIDSQPLLVALLSAWFFGEYIGLWGGLGLLLGLIGISAIGLPEHWLIALLTLDPTLGGQTTSVTMGQSLSWGEGMMLLASLGMALGTVMMPKVSEHVDPVVATGWHAILGAIPLWGLSWGWETQPWQDLTLWDWGALTYATVFGTAIAYGLFFNFAAQGNLTSLSSLTFFTPVFALLFGYWLLGEILTPLQMAGATLTLGSVYLIERRQKLPRLSWRGSGDKDLSSESPSGPRCETSISHSSGPPAASR
ncbi:DMT family transporter [Geitlerinema sp. P-1104]|uniref:DMT family transporter n=1 Tax=Geitlerinema sp. P-1104 TaxID=2546230 RepID=UPI001476C815|nr:DMT family transporter [Geitlerinema sp. P-1104]NMG57054.1 DMT family transporter [Geitlerinema sp. P-1104]